MYSAHITKIVSWQPIPISPQPKKDPCPARHVGSGPHLPKRLESNDANANGSHKAIDVKICGAFGHFVLRMPGCQLVQGRKLGGIGVGMPQVLAKDTKIKSFGETERIATGLSVGTTSEHVFQPNRVRDAANLISSLCWPLPKTTILRTCSTQPKIFYTLYTKETDHSTFWSGHRYISLVNKCQW